MDNENSIKCTVKVQKILYSPNNENSFGIASVSPVEIIYGLVETNSYDCIIIKGNMPEDLNYYDTYTIIAKEVIDQKWGKQYNLVYIGTPMDFTDENKQRIFLNNILTEQQCTTLYATLVNPFEALKNEDVTKLTQVKGIGTKTALKLIEKYKDCIDLSDIYVELDAFGLTPKMINKLMKAYGSPQLVVQKVKQNPYILADEIDGIGWLKADSMALKAGLDPYSPYRIESFIVYTLEAEAQNGNSYMHPKTLMKNILETIGEDIDRNIIRDSVSRLLEKNIIWGSEDKERICLTKYKELEQNIANELLRIMKCPNNFRYDDWERVIKETEFKQGWQFTEQQVEGIKTVLEQQVIMITGYGGTGKSSIVSGMLDVLYRENGYSFAQCALSGKASARLAEVTGEEGYTIHRLLEYNPMEGFAYNKYSPLPYDIIIVDEVSMIGGYLFYDLIQAVKDGAKLIMLCDVGQLESIGVLNIAKDIIESGTIPTVVLTQIHRQAQKSAIVTESLKIRKSEQIIDKGAVGTEIRGELQDLELDTYDDKTNTAPKIIEQFKIKLPLVKDIMDLQIVVPMKTKGESCTFKLNKSLQDIYNPFNIKKNEVKIKLAKDVEYVLRVGDKVINVRNNYKAFDSVGNTIPIFNGNMGIIVDIDYSMITVDFKNIGEILIPKENWGDLELAYAITCHKSQGSEFPIVIVGMDYSAYTMLTKEWVYTAITRAKKYCVLITETNALRYAVSNSKVSQKQTFLNEMLRFK